MKKQVLLLALIFLTFTSCQKIKNEVADFVEESDEAIAFLKSKSNDNVKNDFSNTNYTNPLNKKNHE